MIPSIVLVLTLLALGRWSNGQRFWLIALATLDLAVLMISVTRGFWLGMLTSIIVFLAVLVLKRTLTKRAFAMGLIGSFGAVALVEIVVLLWRRTSLVGALVERVQALLTGDPLSVDVRLAESAAYLESFLTAPALGNGFGAPVRFSATGETTGFAHNQYVFVLQTTGLIGFCLLAALLVLIVWLSIGAVWRAGVLSQADIAPVFVFATFIGFAVTSLISPEFTNVTTSPLLAVSTALLRWRGVATAPRQSEPSKVRRT
jgi:O-antigen ligase